MKIKIILLILLLLTVPAWAYLTELGLAPYQTAVGARPLGLAGAFVSIADDVNAAFFNPGGMPWAKGITLNYKDSGNISAGQAYPTGYGQTLGLGIIKSEVNFPFSGTREANFSSNILMASAATKLPGLPNLGLGINLKTFIGATLKRTGDPDRTASGFEVDLGGLYHVNPWLNLGVSAQNVLPGDTIIRWDNGSSEATPQVIHIGLGAKLIGDVKSPLYLEGNEFFLSSDFELNENRPGAVALGGEWAIANTYFLRSGFYMRENRNAVSLGAGYRQSSWGLDLAYYTEPQSGNQSAYFSVLYFPMEWAFEIKPTKTYKPISLADPLSDLYPPDELSTYDDRIWVRGKAKPGVEVYINDRRIFVDENLKFAVQLPLNPGKNLILIDSYYEDGKLSVTRRVFRRPKVVIKEEKDLEKELKRAKTKEEKARLIDKFKNLEEGKDKLEALVTLGVVEVSPEADFSLEAPVTRGELCTWLVKAAHYPLPRVTNDLFRDVKKDDALAPFIKAVVDRQLMSGFADQTFKPQAPVSAEEAEKIFGKFGVTPR